MHLVLDLDETLIHVSMIPLKNYDFAFKLQNVSYYGLKRPELDTFLKFAFSRFDTVSIWTAATADYAKKVIGFIMTPEQRSRVAFFRTRKDLETVNSSYYKPLKRLFATP
jgi:TFIIF-interacting CTD phosphatase-like protein